MATQISKAFGDLRVAIGFYGLFGWVKLKKPRIATKEKGMSKEGRDDEGATD